MVGFEPTIPSLSRESLCLSVHHHSMAEDVGFEPTVGAYSLPQQVSNLAVSHLSRLVQPSCLVWYLFMILLTIQIPLIPFPTLFGVSGWIRTTALLRGDLQSPAFDRSATLTNI